MSDSPPAFHAARRLQLTPGFWLGWLRRPALDVAEHIMRLRRLRGMSREELATRMGTKQPAIARLETGRSNPRLDTLVKVAEALEAVVRVQFAPVEDVGRRAIGRHWWDVEGTHDRHPDATFSVDLDVTTSTAASRAPAELAAATHRYESLEVAGGRRGSFGGPF